MKVLSECNAIAKVSVKTSTLELEIMIQAQRRFQIKKCQGCRKIILPRMLKVCWEWAEHWEEQLKIPSKKKLCNKNKRKTAKIKGILVREGIVVRDKKEAS
jgi:hypothetical protein